MKQQTAAVTLLVSPDQALLLTDLENDGVIQLALVSRGNEKLAEELLQKQDKAIEDAKKAAEEKKKAETEKEQAESSAPAENAADENQTESE